MASKMPAAVVEQFGKPLAPREMNIPSPGAGQIPGKHRDLRRVSPRSSCSAWRLAGEATAPVSFRAVTPSGWSPPSDRE
jgi:hypothetical protein